MEQNEKNNFDGFEQNENEPVENDQPVVPQEEPKEESGLPEAPANDQPQIQPSDTDNQTEFSPFAYGIEQKPEGEQPFEQNVPENNNGGIAPYQQYTMPPQKPKKNKGLKTFVVVVACVVAIVISLSAGYYIGGKGIGKKPSEQSSDSSQLNPNDEEDSGNPSSFDISQENEKGSSLSATNVVKAVKDSIVSITVYSKDSNSAGKASGIIMSKDGYILTNDHIYAQIPNPKFLITLCDGTEIKASYVSGDSRSDIAILKAEETDGLKPATFGKSSSLLEGETVFAIGQSAGLSSTVTNGIVSALDRRISSGNNTYTEKYIQTTAAINPGNSGGALVNMSGQVVGITSSKYADEEIEGICFAIPVDKALSIVKELQEHGKVVSRVKLGITYTAVTSVAAELNNLPTGLCIQSISPDSGLNGKGIVKGDIITKIDGVDIKNYEQALDIIDSAKVGQEAKISVYQATSKKTMEVTFKYVQAESSSSYTTKVQSSQPSQSSNPEDFLPFNSNPID